MLGDNSPSEQSLAPGNHSPYPPMPLLDVNRLPRALLDTSDELAALEATYQESSFDIGEEAEVFASELDRFNAESRRASPAEKRANVFKLLDSYYTHSRKRADKLRQRQSRGDRPAAGAYSARALPRWMSTTPTTAARPMSPMSC